MTLTFEVRRLNLFNDYACVGCSGQRGLLSLSARRTVLLSKGVGAAFTAIASKDYNAIILV